MTYRVARFSNRDQKDGIAVANDCGQAACRSCQLAILWGFGTLLVGIHVPLTTLLAAVLLPVLILVFSAKWMDILRRTLREIVSPLVIRLPSAFDFRFVPAVETVDPAAAVQFTCLVKLAGGQSRDETAPPGRG